MRALAAEIIKLKRSLAWPVVVLLPLALVLAGAATQLASGEQPEQGWHTVWVQSVVFYGLFPLAIGIAILGSLVWRTEHRGTAWNALMSGPTPTLHIVAAKAFVVAGLTAIMQIVLVLAVVVIGAAAFGLPGMLPGRYLLTGAVLLVATIPLAVLQSGLSMLMRSFAGPIAVALVGAGISVGALLIIGPVAIISPFALATRATQLGTGMFADSGAITAPAVTGIVISSVLLSVGLVALTALVLERRDVRA